MHFFKDTLKITFSNISPDFRKAFLEKGDILFDKEINSNLAKSITVKTSDTYIPFIVDLFGRNLKDSRRYICKSRFGYFDASALEGESVNETLLEHIKITGYPSRDSFALRAVAVYLPNCFDLEDIEMRISISESDKNDYAGYTTISGGSVKVCSEYFSIGIT